MSSRAASPLGVAGCVRRRHRVPTPARRGMPSSVATMPVSIPDGGDGGGALFDAGLFDAGLFDAGPLVLPASPRLRRRHARDTEARRGDAFPGDPQATQIDAFTRAIGASAYWRSGHLRVRRGARAPGTRSSRARPAPATIDEANGDAEAWLATRFDGTHPEWGTFDPSAVYLVFYPDGTTTPQAVGGCGGAYHSSIPITVGTLGAESDGGSGRTAARPPRLLYAVVFRCATSPDVNRPAGLALTTFMASHEVVEAVTDPYDDAFVEAAPPYVCVGLLLQGARSQDMCAFHPGSATTPADLGFTVQRSWSNAAAAAFLDPCVPGASDPLFLGAPIGEGPISLTGTAGGSVGTIGFTIPVGQTRTIEIGFHGAGATTGSWTVTPVTYANEHGQPEPYLQFQPREPDRPERRRPPAPTITPDRPERGRQRRRQREARLAARHDDERVSISRSRTEKGPLLGDGPLAPSRARRRSARYARAPRCNRCPPSPSLRPRRSGIRAPRGLRPLPAPRERLLLRPSELDRNRETRVLVLQHPRERDAGDRHRSGWRASASRTRSSRSGFVGKTPPFCAARCPIRRALRSASLSGRRGRSTSAEHPPEGPVTLIVIDGTWSQAEARLVRDNPRLRALPRYTFHPPAPSEYRIRREPNELYVSTTRSARPRPGRARSATTSRFQALLRPFRAMIDAQSDCEKRFHGGRIRHAKKPRRIGPYVPGLFHERFADLVCVVGEANAWPYCSRERGVVYEDELVHWTACRVASGETFDYVVAPRNPLAPRTPSYVGLTSPTGSRRGDARRADPALGARVRAGHRPRLLLGTLRRGALRREREDAYRRGRSISGTSRARVREARKVGTLEDFLGVIDAPAGRPTTLPPPLTQGRGGARLGGISAARSAFR